MTGNQYLFTHAERLALLRRAAAVLANDWPKLNVWTTLGDDGRGQPVTFARTASGAIRVAFRMSGELIAQSCPAPLTVLDPELFPAEADSEAAAAAEKVAACLTAFELLEVLPGLLQSPGLASLTGAELAAHVERWRDEAANGY